MTQYDKIVHQTVTRCLTDLTLVARPFLDGDPVEDLLWIARVALRSVEAELDRIRDAEREAEIARESL